MLRNTGSLIKVHNEYNLPWSVFLGIAGLPGRLFIFSLEVYASRCSTGKTAYFGWKEHSRAKKVTLFLSL